MPELPEVEILKNELRGLVVGNVVKEVTVSQKKLKRPIPKLDISEEKILRIHRRNKYLILETNLNWLVFHLGMTGKLIYDSIVPAKEHIHCVLSFTNGSYLYYHDPRRFGSIDIFSKKLHENYLSLPLFSKLGVEPLSSDFVFESFEKQFSTGRNIKSFLMDAKYVCGIGNIYACEVLFLAKINPNRKANSITQQEKEQLFTLIPQVLQKSIDLGGSSISDFVHTNGEKGTMQNYYFTYGRENEGCKICGTPILRIKQNGRGTFYCDTCQQ